MAIVVRSVPYPFHLQMAKVPLRCPVVTEKGERRRMGDNVLGVLRITDKEDVISNLLAYCIRQSD